MSTYLDAILDHHRSAADLDDRRTDRLVEQVASLPPCRGFRDALADGERLEVIAEVKRRSPSKGRLVEHLDPGELAVRYQRGGAAALSVLTDAPHFGGSPEDLALARAAVTLPVLRKDFTVAANDVCDARLMGADCVLLIVAALDDVQLRDFSGLASQLGLDVLVEVHDEAELDRALTHAAGTLIGVNQRDLVTFEVDTARAVRMAPQMPEGTVCVAESGVRGVGDARALAAAGYHAVLVGEHLVTSEDPVVALDALRVPTAAARD